MGDAADAGISLASHWLVEIRQAESLVRRTLWRHRRTIVQGDYDAGPGDSGGTASATTATSGGKCATIERTGAGQRGQHIHATANQLSEALDLGKSNGFKPPRPGDQCPCRGCAGRLAVYATRINFVREIRIRYLHCPTCGHLPDANKWILPLEYAPSKR